MLKQQEMRERVLAILDNTEPCELKERILRIYRSGVPTHRKERRLVLTTMQQWAERHLVPSFEDDAAVRGCDAYKAYSERGRGMLRIQNFGSERSFYYALEEAGYTLNRRGAYVTIPGVELVP